MILTTLPAHQRPTMTHLQRRPSAYHSAGESSNSRSRAKHASTTCPAPPSYSSRPSSLNDIALPDYPANPLFANLPSNNDVKAPPIEQEPAQLEAQRPARQAFQPQAHQARVNRPAGCSSTTCAMLGTLFILLRASGTLVLLGVFVLHVLFNVGGDSASKCRANPGHAGCASYRNSTTNATMFGQEVTGRLPGKVNIRMCTDTYPVGLRYSRCIQHSSGFIAVCGVWRCICARLSWRHARLAYINPLLMLATALSSWLTSDGVTKICYLGGPLMICTSGFQLSYSVYMARHLVVADTKRQIHVISIAVCTRATPRLRNDP